MPALSSVPLTAAPFTLKTFASALGWFTSKPRSPAILSKTLTIALVVAATLGLRAFNLGDPLWLDEMHTSWVVSDSLLDVAPRAAIGNQTPLYFWLNWFVAAVYESEISLRLISYLAAGALAGLVADTLWRWCESAGIPPVGPALCGGLLIAVDPVFIFYGTEARPYALLQLVAFWRLRQLSLLGGTSSIFQRAAMIASGAMLVWLHLTGGLIFAGELAAILFWRWQGRNSYSLRNWLIDLVVVGVACLPLAWLITFVFGRRQNFESMIPSPSLMGSFQILHGEELFWPLVVGGVLAIVFDKFVIRGPDTPADGQVNPEKSPPVTRSLPRRFVDIAAGPILWTIATMIFAATLHLLGVAPLFWGRYLIAVIVAVPVAAGAMCGVRSTPLGVFLALLVMALCVQRTGLNQRLFNQDELGYRAIDDRSVLWEDDESGRSPRVYGAVIEAPAIFAKPVPVLVDAALIERDVSWKSESEIERDYSCFPVHSLNPYRIDRRMQSWGLPRDWREGKTEHYLPLAAVESYRRNRGFVVVLLSRRAIPADGTRLVEIIGRETGAPCRIERVSIESQGKATLYWITPDQPF